MGKSSHFCAFFTFCKIEYNLFTFQIFFSFSRFSLWLWFCLKVVGDFFFEPCADKLFGQTKTKRCFLTIIAVLHNKNTFSCRLLCIRAPSRMHANQFVRSMNPFAAVSHIWVFISIYDSHHSILQVDLIFSPRCINRLHRQRRGWKHNSGNQRAVGWEQADACARIPTRTAPRGSTSEFLYRALQRSTPDLWRLAELQPIIGLTFL